MFYLSFISPLSLMTQYICSQMNLVPGTFSRKSPWALKGFFQAMSYVLKRAQNLLRRTVHITKMLIMIFYSHYCLSLSLQSAWLKIVIQDKIDANEITTSMHPNISNPSPFHNIKRGYELCREGIDRFRLQNNNI